MATPCVLLSSPGQSLRRALTPRRLALVLAAAAAVAAAPMLPAQAAPTSQDVAAIVAAKAHELEKITEQFNTARDELGHQEAAAKGAADQVAQAQAQLEAARQQVRGIARSAYTGGGLSDFHALLTSGSAGDFVERVTTLETIAGRQNAVLDQVSAAAQKAATVQVAAQQAAAKARATYVAVAQQQQQLQAQVTAYQKQFDQLSAAEKQAAIAAAGGGGNARASRADREPVAPAGPVVADSKAAQVAVNTALAQRGKPYVWAAAGPGSFDCSGLVMYAFAAAGISLPHSSSSQARMGQPVSRAQLQPGDLIFFYSPISHVGIYIGNGQMVHAPTSGDVVKIADIDAVGRITAMRRIAG